MPETGRPTIGLIPWGDTFEDYLDGVGLDLEAFAAHMTDGWMFGYVRALDRVGFDTVILPFSRRVTQPTSFRHAGTGCRIVALPVTTAYRLARRAPRDLVPWASWLAINRAALRRALLEYDCQALLFQEYEDPRFDVVSRMRLRLPVFGLFQGGRPDSRALVRRIRQGSLRRSAGLLIGSPRERERVRREYGPDAPHLTHVVNPLDLSVWFPEGRASSRAALGVGDQERLIGWHGRVDFDTKGLDLLLDAWRRLTRAADVPPCRLLLVGDGPDATELRARLAAMGDRRVTWINEFVLDRPRMRRLLSALDVYVMASRREGFPVAPTEAMACGVPIVGTAVNGMQEILGDVDPAGQMVPIGDSGALADALAALVRHPEVRERMSLSARRRAETHFSVEAVASQLRGALERVGVTGGTRANPADR